MGDPKYSRRNWRRPKRPLNYDLKMEELKTVGTFGLKTKRELWKAHTELSRIRKQARSLLALREEIRKEKEPVLMNSLTRAGLVKEGSTLDDVLNLQVTDLLSRRLQTIVQSKLGFKTPYQARQAVVHRHIMIGDKIVDIPSYNVKAGEENEISFTAESTLKNHLDKSKLEKNEEVQSENAEAQSENAEAQSENAEAQSENAEAQSENAEETKVKSESSE